MESIIQSFFRTVFVLFIVEQLANKYWKNKSAKTNKLAFIKCLWKNCTKKVSVELKRYTLITIEATKFVLSVDEKSVNKKRWFLWMKKKMIQNKSMVFAVFCLLCACKRASEVDKHFNCEYDIQNHQTNNFFGSGKNYVFPALFYSLKQTMLPRINRGLRIQTQKEIFMWEIIVFCSFLSNVQ